MASLLEVRNLAVARAGKPVLRGLTLTIAPAELHVLMGPNGSGKSTLANALAGAPDLTVTDGSVMLAGSDVLAQRPDARARAGMLLAFQYPVGIPGLSLSSFLLAALQARQPVAAESARPHRPAAAAADHVDAHLAPVLDRLRLPVTFAQREVNEGLSGGEKKKSEIAQLAVLQPKLAILDEPDSGLDIDALKYLAQAIEDLHQQGTAILLITHYNRILQFLAPDVVHVMVEGKIVKSGGPELAVEIERTGYEPLIEGKPQLS